MRFGKRFHQSHGKDLEAADYFVCSVPTNVQERKISTCIGRLKKGNSQMLSNIWWVASRMFVGAGVLAAIIGIFFLLVYLKVLLWISITAALLFSAFIIGVEVVDSGREETRG